jgi:hypothetical protein
VLLRRANKIAYCCSTLGDGSASFWIDRNGPHLRAIDDDAIVAQGPPRKVMSSATNGERQSVRTGPPNGVNNVLDICAANERCWTFVDLPIPQLARLIIGRVLRKDEMAGKE